MKKILFVIDNLEGGGAEKVLVDLVNNLDSSKYSIDLFLLEKKGPYLERVNNNIKVISAYQNEKKWLEKMAAHVLCRVNNLYTRRVFMKYNKDFTNEFLKMASAEEIHRYFFRKNKYDVEIAFLEGMSTKIVSGLISEKTKKIAWVHTDLVEHGWFKKAFSSERDIEECYQRFDDVVCVSEKVKKTFEETYHKNAIVKINPLDSNMVKNKAKEQISIKKQQDVFYYVTVGRFTKEKGIERLLNVHSKLRRDGYNIQLWIIGKGELQEKLNSIIKEKKIEDSVLMLGFQKNPYKYMAQADLYVCSSYVEGLSTTVLESLCLGVPIVTTDCPGMKELLGDSEYGLISENSEDALFSQIKRILDDKSIYEKYKNMSVIRGQQLSIERNIAAIEKIF